MNIVNIALAVVALLALLCLLSSSLREQLKFILFPLLIFCSGCLVYYLITGNSPTEIPSAISSYFSDSQLQDEASHQYYDKKRMQRYEKEIE